MQSLFIQELKIVHQRAMAVDLDCIMTFPNKNWNFGFAVLNLGDPAYQVI